jgi:hypothetical protein
MKVGDLVKNKAAKKAIAGLIVDIVQKKCWRTHILGKSVDWNKIEPEPHAVVLIGEDYRTIPLAELELVSENR